MANYSFHYMIATHEDKSKVKDLYEYSYSRDFFEKIFPSPAEFIDEINEEKAHYPKGIRVSDKLNLWRKENWGGNESPFYESGDIRKLSKSGTIFTTYFAMRSCIPFGIYDELHRQGFRVKAYYHMRDCFCGSYIYGVHEHIRLREEGQDVPDDIDWIFGIEYFDYPREIALRCKDKEEDETRCNTIKSGDDNLKYFMGIADEINMT